MKMQDRLKMGNRFLAIFFLLTCMVSFCFAQTNVTSNETVANEAVSNKESVPPDIVKAAGELTEAIVPASPEVKEIQKRQANTEEVIKKKEEQLQGVQEKAQQAIDAKETLEKELQLKKQAAVAARTELDAVKQQLELKKTPELAKKAKTLAAEAEKFEKEVAAYQARLDASSSKAAVAQQEIDLARENVNQLKEALENIKKEKAAKRSWVEKGIMASVLIFIGLVLFLLIKLGVKKFEELVTEKGKIRESEMALRVKTLSHLFYWLGTLAIFAIITYMVLQTFGFDVAPLLAGAGIVGLAFGFGGQYLIRDVINGFFILLEGQYRIDDVVKIGEFGGLVENINLRITTLRDLEGRVIIIPNGEIKTVVNFTREYAQALFDIGVAYKENVDRVMQVIKDLGGELRKDPYFGKLILGDLEMFGVDDFGDSQVTIKFRIKTLPIKQWEVSREFRRRMKNRFDELGIEIPFPHRTLYFGTGADNDWLKKIAQKNPPGK